MIDAYNLSDAAPVALFGMFALWAAESKRHWFVRTAVVGGALLVALLIPAFEVVVLLAVESLLVVAGIAIWRRRRRSRSAVATAPALPRFRFQLSMETMLLAVVIVAVVTAVVARTPQIEPLGWFQCILQGIITAIIGLACVWIVCGRARWWIRLAAAPILPLVLGAAYHALQWTGNIVNHWFRVSTPTYDYLQIALRDTGGLLYWIKVTTLGMVVLCLWLLLMRRAQWFDPFHDTDGGQQQAHTSRRHILWARVSAAALFGIVAIFPLALFYRLVTPEPIPQVVLPNPNGYDDLLAAGNMIGPAAALTLQNWDQLTIAQLRSELAKHQAAFDRMYLGLERLCVNPYVFKPWPAENSRSWINLSNAFYAKSALARRTKDLEQELANNLTLLRLAQEERRGNGTNYFPGIFAQSETDTYTGIWSCAPRLSADKCIELIGKLRDIDARRVPWAERLAIERAVQENAGWQAHLWVILADWSGGEMSKWERIEECRRVAQLRILIIKLAILAFLIDNNRPPTTLDELVPKYMPEVPIDPFGGGKLHYVRDREKYTVYSCGPDQDDDGGQPRTVVNDEELGDMTDDALFVSPVFQPSSGPP